MINLFFQGRIQGLEFLALLLLGVLVLGYGLQYAQVVIMEQLGQRVMHALRLDLVAHLLSLPLPFYQQHPVGRLVTRATNDIENLNEMVKSLLATLVKDILLFLGIMGVLFYLNFKLALITFAVLPIIFVAARLFSRKARDAFRDLRRWVAQLNSFIQETLSGMTLIQLLKKEDAEGAGFPSGESPDLPGRDEADSGFCPVHAAHGIDLGRGRGPVDLVRRRSGHSRRPSPWAPWWPSCRISRCFFVPCGN